ncbi:uncharacterized protein METZ01_LOCUS130969 [marine metagenome]|uniref:Glycosyltransferase RgtA/B/C/D-like domain-containing protein n=1 Tax=marine metagenome TaxID=408172 RepID=A0A381YM69_9ZZZZ
MIDTSFRQEVLSVLPAFVVSKCLVLLAWLLSKLFSGTFDSPNGERINRGLMAWDGDWYASIVTNGYDDVLIEGIRFFPGYIFAGRFFNSFIPGSAAVSLILIANIASLITLMAIKKLVLIEKGSEELAKRSVWLLSVFPSAFVLTWAYAESLFLALSIFCFVALRKEQWKIVIFCSFAAALVRPTGLLLTIPIFCAIWESWKINQRKMSFQPIVALISGPVGSGIYILWASLHFDELFAPIKAQESFRGSFVDPFSRVIKGVSRVLTGTSATETLHIISALLLLFLLVKLFKDWPLRYGLFSSSCMVVALGAENINSLERYALNGFPVILSVLLLVSQPRLRLAVPFVSAFCMVSLCTFAWLGVYVP